jgi:hypothetical protein
MSNKVILIFLSQSGRERKIMATKLQKKAPQTKKTGKKAITTLDAVSKPLISFLDDTKKMIQCVKSTPVFDGKQAYNCFWCTLPIKNSPLGCPIKSIPIYKNKNTAPELLYSIEQQPNENKYLTTGIFCSFNCIKAYIIANRHDFTFNNSTRLLANMYAEITGDNNPVTIEPAPHMSLLMMYGGTLTPEQYQESFNRVIYIDRGVISMYPISYMYEETTKLCCPLQSSIPLISANVQ